MMIYLLKANVCLSIFLLIYWGFLRKNTFYRLNRIYFLLAIIGTIALPLLNVSDFVNQHQEIRKVGVINYIPDLSFKTDNQLITSCKTQKNSTQNSKIQLNFSDLLKAIFLSGVVVLLCKLVVQIVSIFRFLRISTPLIIYQTKVRNLSGDVSPFSFFNYIFVNIHRHSEEDLSEIVVHESAHARQFHSVDVMMIELFCVVFWVNPFAWIMRKFLKQNLEFLTDKTVIGCGFEVRHYQYNLLKISGLNPISVSNNFNFSDLKLRIKMMNKKRSSKLNLLKYFLTIPLGAVLILAFNISKAKPFNVRKSVMENVNEMIKAVEFKPSISAIKNIVNLTEQEDIPLTEPLSEKIIQNEKLTSDSTQKKSWNSGNAHVNIVNVQTGEGLKDVKIYDHEGTFLGKTNFQGICFYDFPKAFDRDSLRKIIPKDTIKFGDKFYPIYRGNTFHKIILRYKNYPDFEAVLKNFNRLCEVKFNNGKFEVEQDIYTKYLDKIDKDKNKTKSSSSEGYDRKGNLVIAPKTKWFYCKEDVIKELQKTQELSIEKRPLYKINNAFVATNFDWNTVNIKSILNLDYWSPEDDEKLVSQFGESARNGIYNLNVLEKGFDYKIVKIDAKNFSDIPPPPMKNTIQKCTPSVDFPPNALYVIDGKLADSGYLHKNVQVEDIDKLEVMEAKSATEKYGEKAKKGVILITLKKEKALTRNRTDD